MEEATFEELNGHHSKDEHKEHVDNQDVQHILQRVDHAVEDSLQGRDGDIYKCSEAVWNFLVDGRDNFREDF